MLKIRMINQKHLLNIQSIFVQSLKFFKITKKNYLITFKLYAFPLSVQVRQVNHGQCYSPIQCRHFFASNFWYMYTL